MRACLAALGCLYLACAVGAFLDPARNALSEVEGAQSPAIPPYAWLLHSTSGAPRESRADILDTPVLPGSLIKAVTLLAALEDGAISSETKHICRRSVTVDGRRYTCSHPDLKRPMTPAEALAHSCNDFFVSLASRLPRRAVDRVRTRLGLPPMPPATNYAAALVGLDGPRISPRALLAAYERVIGIGADSPVTFTATARRVLIDGLRGAATYGSASELAERRIAALAKTGTSSMPGGGVLGMALLLMPPEAPTRALIVVAPGAAGRDAVSLAADLVRTWGPALAGPNSGPPKGGPHVRLGRDDGRVESIALEDYVARVVAAEGEPSARPAAMQALAIAARTFTVANRGRHDAEGFDVCDTTHCQVLRASTAASRAAAAATAGRVLLRHGAAAPVHYSAWCGGHTEVASGVWPGAIDASVARPDAACAGEPRWTNEVTVAQIEQALRAIGTRGTALRSLRIAGRSKSGRVTRLRAEGFTPSDVAAEDLRIALGRTGGWQLMKSTLFDVKRSPRGYVLSGTGSGHGVGLCVIGAGHRAAAGESVESILRFYYPELALGELPASGGSNRLRQGYGESAKASATAEDPPLRPPHVGIALPLDDEPFRAALTDLVRRARDEVAIKARVAAPSFLRVTVHPTVESFGRATGRRSWFAGATSGTSIELMPLAVLRKRGVLDRTVRHEVAHAVIDRELAGRPLWVREGAAAHFSGSSRLGGMIRSTGSCPTDAELLSPASDAEASDAYRRADACFGAAVRTKDWRLVGRGPRTIQRRPRRDRRGRYAGLGLRARRDQIVRDPALR
jgi:SpoIID/LytB domain protein